MKKAYAVCILSLLTLTSISQQKLLDYKHVIDLELTNHFDRPLINQMKCSVVSMIGFDSIESVFTSNYVPTKNDMEKFLSITFSYKFYSKAIDNVFEFDMTISKNKTITTNLDVLTEIPICARYNQSCDFIKKDSAIKIALADSIKYSNNLSTHFVKRLKLDKYYWLIIGRPEWIQKRGAKKSPARKMSPNQQKIVDALTGKIISRQEYNGL